MDENFMPLLVQCSTQMKKLVRGSNLLNGNQCLHMTNISSLLVEGIQSMVKTLHGKVKLGSSMEDLYRVMKRVEVIIQDCGKVDWVRASLWQMDNEEEFREVLEELRCNFDTMCGQFQSMGVNVHGLQESINFSPIKFLEVEKDQKALESRLLAHIQATKESPEEQEIVKHAHKRLSCRMDGEGRELDAVNFPTYHWSPELTTSLGIGSAGQVYMTKCFGLDVAAKVFEKVDGEEYIIMSNANYRKEVGVLAGLSHPNIIKFICCGEILDNQKFGNYIVMEKMDKNLTDHLDNKTLRKSYLVTIDIIMQIARGMFYLHDMNVAHRDLKPENVLVKSWGDSKLDGMGYVKVKLADFGIAKIKAKDVYEEPTLGKLGTTRYRAPETFLKGGKANAFKSDVFSFAMLCSYVLTITTPFQGRTPSSIKKSMEDGERPKLPLDCPKSLATLIEQCWCLQPSERPTFEHICMRLGKVKGELLENTQKISNGWINLNTFGQNRFHLLQALVSCFWLWFQVMVSWMRACVWFISGKMNGVDHVNIPASTYANKGECDVLVGSIHCMELTRTKVEHNGAQKLVGMDKRKLKVMTELVKHSMVVIIGMGGMGKTTLAKYVMEHMCQEFDVSCFTFMKAQGCGILEILSNLGVNHENVIDIAEGRRLLEEKITKKRTLMVLDDIGSVDQIHELMDLEIFKVTPVKNKMIITTRDWGLVESLEGAQRVDMNELNLDEAMNLFTLHVCDNQRVFEIPPHVEDIAKRIVETCRGLPLSLKVVGSTLRGINRVHIWMRTLQRL